MNRTGDTLEHLKDAILFREEFVCGSDGEGEILHDVDIYLMTLIEMNILDADHLFNVPSDYQKVEILIMKRLKKAWLITKRLFLAMDIFDKRTFCIRYWEWLGFLKQNKKSLGKKAVRFLWGRGDYIRRVLSAEIELAMSVLKNKISPEKLEVLMDFAERNMDYCSIRSVKYFLNGVPFGWSLYWIGPEAEFQLFKDAVMRSVSEPVSMKQLQTLFDFAFRVGIR